MVKITLGVEGMACGMCESHINDEIRKNLKVKKVSSSHGKGETDYHAPEEIAEADSKMLSAATGYEMTSYKSNRMRKRVCFPESSSKRNINRSVCCI